MRQSYAFVLHADKLETSLFFLACPSSLFAFSAKVPTLLLITTPLVEVSSPFFNVVLLHLHRSFAWQIDLVLKRSGLKVWLETNHLQCFFSVMVG